LAAPVPLELLSCHLPADQSGDAQNCRIDVCARTGVAMSFAAGGSRVPSGRSASSIIVTLCTIRLRRESEVGRLEIMFNAVVFMESPSNVAVKRAWESKRARMHILRILSAAHENFRDRACRIATIPRALHRSFVRWVAAATSLCRECLPVWPLARKRSKAHRTEMPSREAPDTYWPATGDALAA
jgi:hypothetical protein